MHHLPGFHYPGALLAANPPAWHGLTGASQAESSQTHPVAYAEEISQHLKNVPGGCASIFPVKGEFACSLARDRSLRAPCARQPRRATSP